MPRARSPEWVAEAARAVRDDLGVEAIVICPQQRAEEGEPCEKEEHDRANRRQPIAEEPRPRRPALPRVVTLPTGEAAS